MIAGLCRQTTILLGTALALSGCGDRGSVSRGEDPAPQAEQFEEATEALSAPAETSELSLPPELPGEWAPVEGTAIRPFWRRGARPTYAPPWSASRGDVTREIAQADGETDLAAGDRLSRMLQELQPGDHLLLREGTYRIERRLMLRAAGSEARPIVIRGAPGETVTILRPDASQNVIDIDGAQYLALESLRIRGGSNAIKFHSADHILLYDLDVSACADAAITANAGPTSYLSIVDCEISHTGGHGEGLYLGGHNGAEITHHAAVVGNYIHDLGGPTVRQGDGIELKQGSYACVVRYNFVQNTHYPGVTAYGTGRDLSDRNVIEANVIIDTQDYAMQVCADAVIRNNLVINSRPDGRAFLSKREEVATPQNLFIVNNTFLASGRAVVRNGWNDGRARGIVMANNALYSHVAEAQFGAPGDAMLRANVYLKTLDEFVDVDLGAGGIDAAPTAGSRLIGTGDPQFTPDSDLLGRPRSQDEAVAGALMPSPSA